MWREYKERRKWMSS